METACPSDGTRWHTELLYEIVHGSPVRPLLTEELRQRWVRPNAAIPSPLPEKNTPDKLPQFANSEESLTYDDLCNRYTATIYPLKTKGFLADLVTDVSGPTVARWQILIWTLVLGGIYVGKAYANLKLPEFGPTLLALMGISSGIYLGFKVPENHLTKEKKENPRAAAESLAMPKEPAVTSHFGSPDLL